MKQSPVASMQKNMVRFCRTGDEISDLGMPRDRALIYRNLIFPTIQETLLNYYPLTHQLLGQELWEKLTHDFFANYPSSVPYFWKMPKGLVDYVRVSSWGEKHSFFYLADLLAFEWLEIEVYMMPDIPFSPFCREGDLMGEAVYLNPEHRMVIYSFPVFQQFPLPEEIKRGEYPLFCYRHPESKEVRFFALSRFFHTVLEQLETEKFSGKEALIFSAGRWGVKIDDKMLGKGKAFLEDLFNKGAILGHKRRK